MASISAIIVFHAEGPIAGPSLQSFHQTVEAARSAGHTVEAVIACDRMDKPTREMVTSKLLPHDRIIDFDFGDLSDTRNAAITATSGDYVALFDGDDLWSTDWLTAGAHAAAEYGDGNIYHPEYLFYFSERDALSHSVTEIPAIGVQSMFFRQTPSSDPTFDPVGLLFENVWSAHSFCPRHIYQQFPYQPFRRGEGLGIEDWSWNLATWSAGITHAIVPETLHVIRIKEAGSLGVLNASHGLMPFVPEGMFDLFYSAPPPRRA